MTQPTDTVTLTLSQKEASLAIASLRRSTRPSVRLVANRIRGQVTLPLWCPHAFKTADHSACGEFAQATADETIIGLRNHIATVHGVVIDEAEFQAKVAWMKWSPPAE